MASLFIDDAPTGRAPIKLSSAIAQGAAGTIHHVEGRPGIVVKLYKNAAELPMYREKILAMLNSPPNLQSFDQGGRTYVQIAWPTARIFNDRGEFRGFAMPEVDFKASTDLENVLQKSTRKRKGLPEAYGLRVVLAANLAALCAELHGLGHYMVDMKPVNMRFYPNACYMAILDTDGFSVNGKPRFPARQFSDEYIAPEAATTPPENLGLEQDLFSLAVIIFRLLNNGIHPYQGVDLADHPTSLQERIFAGLYAYGTTPHPTIRPSPPSIHGYFEESTRRLFDRAFQNRGPRPSAKEWRDHLNELVRASLVKCAKNSDHAHFSKGCGLCAIENGRPSTSAPPSSSTKTIQNSSAILSQLATGPRSGPTQPSRTGGAFRTHWSPRYLAALLLLGAGCIFVFVQFQKPARTRTESTEPQTQQANTPHLPSPAAARNFKLINAVLANTIENGKPKQITRTFSGAGAPIALYFEYQDARANQDEITITVTDGMEKTYPCTTTTLLYSTGSLNCSWVTGASTEQKVSVALNGKAVQDLTFKIAPPPVTDRKPLDLSPAASGTSVPQLPDVAASDAPSWLLTFKKQVDRCRRSSPPIYGGLPAKAAIAVSLGPDGYLTTPPRKVGNVPSNAQQFHQGVVDAIVACQPFNLPSALASEWRYFIASFEERNR